MQIDGFRLCLFGLGQLFVLAAMVHAQAPGASGGKSEREQEKPSSRPRQAVERVEPDIYYTRDKNGELVPLLNHSLEEIRRLLELKEETLSSPRSSFRIERLNVTAEAVGDHARLSVELSIAANGGGWIRVPLRFGGLALTDLPEFADDGEHLIDFDADVREYVAWFRDKTPKTHQLLLHGLARIESDGIQTRLRLNAPRAISSELELIVPDEKAVGQVLSGAVLADTKDMGGRTKFRATGLTSDFSLTWRSAEARQAQSPLVLAAEGQIVSQIDGRGVDTTATLRVNAFGRDFTGFQVRLPRGAMLLAADHADYSVIQLPVGDNTPEVDRQRAVVDIKLKVKSSTPVNVEIKTKQGHDMTSDAAIDLGGFDVVGAVRQSGFLAVHASDDWQVTFAPRQGVLQTDALPPEMRGDGVVAGFNYFGQPFSLPVRVSPRQSRTSVDPSFVVQVGPHHLQIEGNLKYHIAGAKVFSFSMDLGDWQLDPAGFEPAALVNSAALVFGPGNSVLIPLKQATTGNVELRIRARKAIASDAKTVSFGLPRLTADTLGSTDLAVVAEDTVVLTPRSTDMFGLLTAPPNANIRIASQQQSPWFYRSDVADPHFAADFHVASRHLTTHFAAEMTFADEVVKVVEKLTYDVAHEAADSLPIVVPQPLAQNDSLTITWREQPLTMEPMPAAEPRQDDCLAARIQLPEPQLGTVEVTISYVLSDDVLDEVSSRAASVRLEIPLIMPGEGDYSGGEVTIVCPSRLDLEAIDARWNVESASASDDNRHRLLLRASQTSASIALGVSPAENRTGEPLIAQRTWIQTWLTDTRRFERAVFQFRSTDKSLRVKLPPGRSNERFTLDGDEIAATPGDTLDERVFSVNVTQPATGHVLELTYELETRPGVGDLSLPLPELVGTTPTRQVYWQLVLPGDEYLLTGPSAWASNFAWLWRGLVWSRWPLLDTPELEVWSGSHEHESPLPPSVNAYLFSGSAPRSTIEIRTISRAMLVFVSSGFFMAVGLVWIYVPVVRSPAMILAAGVLLVAVAARWPDLSLLAVQGGVLGALLIALAAVLERRFGDPVTTPVRASPSSIVGRSSTHYHARLSGPANLSTQTAAVAVELGADAE